MNSSKYTQSKTFLLLLMTAESRWNIEVRLPRFVKDNVNERRLVTELRLSMHIQINSLHQRN